ncbi:3-oxo-tetronate kinase [Deinococcus yavapaiensis]|nr:3-oxo-tetronate kinase [Deinococcus yavapaiensis]
MPSLGVIADDFTGGTDVASNLRSAGWRVVQTIDVPDGTEAIDADAVVVALKSRTAPPQDAVLDSLAALAWLRRQGCTRFYFKYCSTFDSTPRGNIGPVIDALLNALGETFTIACPAFPDNGRTVYAAHLFVHGVLLSESGMRNHPLTPMTDANLPRVLSAQSASKVGALNLPFILRGEAREALRRLRADGVNVAITDTVTNDDLARLADATSDLTLLTGGSGLAAYLTPPAERAGAPFQAPRGPRAILAGSCSPATLAQLGHARTSYPSRHLDPLDLARDFDGAVNDVVTWAAARLSDVPVVIAASDEPARVKAAQNALGVERAGTLVEDALARIAARLVDLGVRQLGVAGGETSGAVTKALGVRSLEIGPAIDPGVPWTIARGSGDPIALALKSGNFGGEDFLVRMWSVLP